MVYYNVISPWRDQGSIHNHTFNLKPLASNGTMNTPTSVLIVATSISRSPSIRTDATLSPNSVFIRCRHRQQSPFLFPKHGVDSFIFAGIGQNFNLQQVTGHDNIFWLPPPTTCMRGEAAGAFSVLHNLTEWLANFIFATATASSSHIHSVTQNIHTEVCWSDQNGDTAPSLASAGLTRMLSSDGKYSTTTASCLVVTTAGGVVEAWPPPLLPEDGAGVLEGWPSAEEPVVAKILWAALMMSRRVLTKNTMDGLPARALTCCA